MTPGRRLAGFLHFVEIRTKVASLFPYLLGTAYAWARHGVFRLDLALVLLGGVLAFDMTTTAINNHMEYTLRLRQAAGDGAPAAPMKEFGLGVAAQRGWILAMLSIATALGLVLVVRTDPVLLLVGVACFGVGILYTAGPVSFSHMPLGEVLSGSVMGFLIPFLAIQVQLSGTPAALASLSYQADTGRLVLEGNVPGLLALLLLGLPPACAIANIMLANNVCDLEEDRRDGRFTLPHYLGIPRSLALFAAVYALGFAALALQVVFGVLPLYGLAALLPAIPVIRNVARFRKYQSKAETFGLSVDNFLWLSVPPVLLHLLRGVLAG